ncbi:MAG: YdcF family protein [Flavobacteriia bacterium]|nr:YdcF family protein [Flavobacteriia bacterium]
MKKILLSNWKKVILYSFLVVLLLIFWSNYRIYSLSKHYIYDTIKEIPSNRVGLLLGTSRNLKSGNENAYFFNRIETTIQLYQAGKIKFILVSGDNGTKEYNEPEDMKAELIKRGVPESKIFLDFAGFDTYDSMIRAQKVFGLNKFTVISQKFHNQRAIYIARENKIDAVGCNAPNVAAFYGIKTKIREIFACVKAYLEVKTAASPKFLGEKIVIE